MASFVMAGGGTGGHVIPALAVARELRARGHQVRLHRHRARHGSKLVPAAGFPHRVDRDRRLERVGLPRRRSRRWRSLPFSVLAGRAHARSSIEPAAVFSMGGYVAGPVVLAALWSGLPLVVMEPNAIPGFTNRKIGRFVTRALVSFPEAARVVSAGPIGGDRAAGARGIFRDSRRSRATPSSPC